MVAALQNSGFTIDITTPQTGELRSDLISLLDRFVPLTEVLTPITCKQLVSEALVVTSAGVAEQNALYMVMSDQNWIVQQVDKIIAQAQANGDIQDRVLTSTQKSLPAILLIQQLVLTCTLTKKYVTEVVDTILLPIFLS